MERVNTLMEHPDLPPAVSDQLTTMAEADERGTSAQELRLLMEDHAAAQAERVGRDVKDAFVRATTRVYLLTVWILVAAVLLATRIPELPLRKTQDRVVMAKGE